MKQIYLLFAALVVVLSLNGQYIYNDYDANQNQVFLAWPNAPVIVGNPDASGLNTSANVAQWERTNWAQWDNVYTELSGKIDFTTGTVFSIKVHSPIVCNVLFKLEDKANGGIFVERTLPVTSANQWVQLDFDFSGEASGVYDKIVFFLDFASFNANTFYFDEIEGPHYDGSQGKLLEAADVQDNFQNNGFGTIANWIFQNPGLDPLPTTVDPVNSSNTVADYNRTGAFEWANAQAELDHRMDLSTRNVFEMDVYFPSTNNYSGGLTSTVDIKLQNSLLGGNAWTTEAVVQHTVNTYDQWVTLQFDFSAWSAVEDYDKIVVQFGGQGHWDAGQFYFDNLELLPVYATTPYIYNDFDANQNHLFEGWPNMPAIVVNPDNSGINTSAHVAEWSRSADQWAHVYSILDGRIDFTTGSNFQLKIHAPVMCQVLFKLEDKNNPAVAIERSGYVNDVNQWVMLNFDFEGAASDTYDKIIIFIDFASTSDNIFYFDEVTGPEYEAPKPILELDIQDNFENDGWGTITNWMFQDPILNPLNTITDPVNSTNTVADYNRSGTFEWTNAQFILDHRMDLSERNIFQLDVYFPSSNNYNDQLTPTAAIKLQNSLLGANAWTTQTEVKHTVTTYDSWQTLEFDFSSVSGNIDYDQIVVQLGGEGHFNPALLYFDNLYLKHVPFVTVVSPNGGEMIDQGSVFNIEWEYDYWDGQVIVELIKGEGDPQLVGLNVNVSDTILAWNVYPNQEPGSDYRIIITSMSESFPSDTSDSYFTIVEVTLVQSNFSANPTTLSTADSTLFTDMSTGSPTSWEWTFEGGSPASFTGQNPPYVHYTTPGNYDVTLVVSNGIESSTFTKEDYIVVYTAPMADFAATQTVILAGQSTDFTNLSQGEDLTYDWFFEGGTPEFSSEESPVGITYYEIGSFDVRLIVSNGFGADTLLMEDYIEALPVGINDNLVHQIAVSPIPASNFLNISQNKTDELNISLFDLSGKQLLQIQSNQLSTTLDVTTINAGVYILSIESKANKTLSTQKIIIK